MKTDQQQLIQELESLTTQHLAFARQMTELSDEELGKKSSPESWNALECIEHLNRYGLFYLPEIDKQIKAANFQPTKVYKAGWLGNYFAKSMWPNEKLNKMKTFKSMNPVSSKVERKVLDIFISQLQTLLDLLHRAKNTNLRKVKTAISISPFIKLQLGDTFRVIIYHNERHIRQAKRAIALNNLV